MTALDDLAPWPATEDQVTAAAVLRHLTVAASVHEHDTHTLARNALTPGAAAEDVAAYVDAVRQLKARFGLVFLLRQIQQQSSQTWADDVARHLWSLWQDGGCIPEFLWDWLAEHGIDPKTVAALTEGEAA